MNRGDTSYLMLNYTINGDPLIEGGYEEIELQLNSERNFANVKKLLSKGDIHWGTVDYTDNEGQPQSFTGYYARLSQEETFKLNDGSVHAQIRVLLNGDVGSSAIEDFRLGQVLSEKVLTDEV